MGIITRDTCYLATTASSYRRAVLPRLRDRSAEHTWLQKRLKIMANECFLSLSFSSLIIMARRRGVYESKAVTRAGGRKKREKRKKIIVLWVTLPRRSKYLRAEVRVHLNADTPGGRFPLSAEATANVNLFSGLPLPWFHRRIFHSSF